MTTSWKVGLFSFFAVEMLVGMLLGDRKTKETIFFGGCLFGSGAFGFSITLAHLFGVGFVERFLGGFPK